MAQAYGMQTLHHIIVKVGCIINFKNVCVYSLSRVQLCVMLWTVAHQAPLSVGFSRQEYWSRLPFPPPGDLPYQGSTPQADSLPLTPPGKPWVHLLSYQFCTVIFLWFFLHNLFLIASHIWLRSNLYNKVFILRTPGWTSTELILKMIEFLKLVYEEGY